MIVRLSCFLLFVVIFHDASAAVPSFIKVCKRNDPKINECIVNSINLLKPYLIKGIPEMEIPPVDPMKFKEFVLSRGGNFRAIGTNVVVRGASNYKVISLKADVHKLIFQFEVEAPFINIEADYDVNMKLLNLNLKGKGPLQSNNTDVTFQAVLKAHKVKKNGKNYVIFDTLDTKIKWKSYNIKLENLFGTDKTLGDAVNIALNENKKEVIELIRPTVEKMVSGTLLKLANQISKHYTYEEYFPEK